MSEPIIYNPHFSVLKKESLEFLTASRLTSLDESLFADLTFGAGGHTKALLEMNPLFKVVAVDQDPEAICNGQKVLQESGLQERCELLHINFEKFPEEIRARELQLHGILMDLGVSSHHFDSAERGFSFRFDGPLDMRMNVGDKNTPSAADLLNSLSIEELTKIITEYGEDPLAHRIAENIVLYRQTKLFQSTKELEDLVFHCYPKKWRYGRTHPATKTFQALRIAVNNELTILERVLPPLFDLLLPGGRLAIITFHSLEDRIVKHTFKNFHQEKRGELLTKKPILAQKEELLNNSRSRSAKLRVIIKK